MSTSTENQYHSTPAMSSGDPEGQNYRSVSKTAVMCFVFAILGLLSFLSPVFVLLPALGVGFGIMALASLSRYPEELTGKPVAQIGIALSALLLIGSVGLHAYIYVTEVPEGYDRISFYDLKRRAGEKTEYSNGSIELDGRKVFLKGYVRLNDKMTSLKNFILVPDFGSCCFGGSPDMRDIVAVSIKSEDTIDHSYSVRKIGGVFRLNKRPIHSSEKDIPGVLYEIDADYIR